MASSSSSLILRSLRELREPIRVNGISSSAASHFLATWAQEPGSTLLAIAPDEEAAQAMAEEIETLAKALLGQSIRTAVLPSWEQSPYSSISPSIRTRLGRIRAISQVFSDQPPQVIITTLAAGLQRTLPLRALRERSLRVAVGASVDSRERVVTHLLAAGYLRSDPVEDPGTFAVRGDIIDVFPPDRDVPLRIELFGDEIEKIREFDPETQRATAENAPSAVILGPARETSLDPGAIPRLRERIKARADDAGIPRSVRDPIVEQLGSEIYPSHSEFWASFQYAESPCFFQLFHESYPGARVGVVDELSCDQTWDEQLAEFKRQETESIKDGLILPDVSGLFCLEETLGRVATRGPVVYLDRIEMANLESVGETPEEPDAEEKISTRHKSFVRFNSDLGQGGKHRLDELEPKIKLWMKQGFRTVVLAATPSQAERLTYLLQERGIAIAPSGHPPDPSRITIAEGTLREGYRWPSEGWVVVTDSEILGSKAVHRRKRGSSSSGSAAKDWSNLQALTDLSVGDAVVHFDHGIGRYQGIVRLDITGAANDFLLLEYANKDKLYLPVYRLNVIQKYMGAGGEGAPLDKLGGPQFAKAKEKVREAVRKIAFDLVQLYAERQIRAGLRLSPRDSSYREFEAKFPFDETPDQLRAIDAALDDMESGRVMDRLVCGDVGYGKTEVAIRAAYAAVNDGHQVAVLVPTTVLAHQHELSFRNRMKDLPIRIESVSRFKSAKEQKEIIQGVESGKIDIVVGTHRLLSKDVRFKNLALVIVDEEHRFGVEHKEKLKTLRVNTHAMTLSATPIPRTLHMALSGLREISLINTAPVDRLPIRTYVSRFDEALIQRAVQTELARGGQVFFVHNRVQTIFETAKLIQDLVPQAQIGVGHGQMGEGKLEEVMMDFYQKKTNVLVCTTIIESGIDIPSANTIVIDRADAFGLAQLYQLRGRVGRGQARAYAYLLLPAEGSITEDAKKRLEVIQKFVELGSGFAIASHDLEIRGGGDLLGAAQSGHIETVGFELYTELLEEAVREIQGKPLSAEDSHREPEIKVPFSAVLSETYVPDVHQRLSLYRRLSGTTQEQQIDDIEIELQDRYGPLPEEAKNLLWLIRVKQLLKVLGIDALTVGPERVVLTPGNGSKLDPVRAIALVSGHGKRYQLTPDSKFIAQVKTLSLKDLYFTVSTLLKDLLPR